jgi:hypothetical protein
VLFRYELRWICRIKEKYEPQIKVKHTQRLLQGDGGRQVRFESRAEMPFFLEKVRGQQNTLLFQGDVSQ